MCFSYVFENIKTNLIKMNLYNKASLRESLLVIARLPDSLMNYKR